MSIRELLKKVKKLDIQMRSRSNQLFAGEYNSKFKGQGMSFSEVREYMFGDDIRRIDWNVTARFNEPHIKVFEEERELNIILLVDISFSMEFGTQSQSKHNILSEIIATIAYSAIKNNDKVGLVLFDKSIVKFIPVNKGKGHFLRIIRDVLYTKPRQAGTDIVHALKFTNNIIKKRAHIFLISDFFAPNFLDALQIVKKRHDLLCLKIADDREINLPKVGLIKSIDRETQNVRWINTYSSRVRMEYTKNYEKHLDALGNMFKKNGIPNTLIHTGEDYMKLLIEVLKK